MQISLHSPTNVAFHTGPLPRPRRKRPRPTPTCAVRKVLVLGGTGRVGTETLRALLPSTPGLQVTLAGRNASRMQQAQSALAGIGDVAKPAFTRVDITDERSIASAVSEHDLVLHTAGPFQQVREPTAVLAACIDARVPYLDICDDLSHSSATKGLHERAVAAGVPALISTGIYPGLSNLMAAEAAQRLSKVDELDLFYHTAGSGGIGATVLASTFLLLSESAAVYTSSGPRMYAPASQPVLHHFGDRIGPRLTYLLNLPEVASIHRYIVPDGTVSARFSTAPPVWNVLLRTMARLPRSLLANRPIMRAFANFSMPIVKAVDRLSGARTGIDVKACGEGHVVLVRYEHERLAACVGEATAAFVRALLVNDVQPGVWYPEELPSSLRNSIVTEAVARADEFVVRIDDATAA